MKMKGTITMLKRLYKRIRLIIDYLSCRNKFELCDLNFMRRNKRLFINFKNNLDEIEKEIICKEKMDLPSKNIPNKWKLDYLFGRQQELVVNINGHLGHARIMNYSIYSNSLMLESLYGSNNLNNFATCNCTRNLLIMYNIKKKIKITLDRFLIVTHGQQVNISFEKSLIDSFILIESTNE